MGSTNGFLWVFSGDGFRLPDSSLLNTYRAEMTTQWVNNPKSNKIKYFNFLLLFLNSVLCGKTRRNFFVFCYVIIKKTISVNWKGAYLFQSWKKPTWQDFSLSMYFFTGFSTNKKRLQLNIFCQKFYINIAGGIFFRT